MTQWMMGVVATAGLTTALVACADTVEAIDSCAKRPSAKGCKSDKASSPETTYASTTPIANTPPPPPAVPDAGAPKPPDAAVVGPKPKVPPMSSACRDLSACCAKVKDTLEKAACTAIAVQQQGSLCANAVIAYQVFGGCGHSGFSLPDIFNADKSRNTSKDCTYLNNACIADASQCDAAYTCNGVSSGGTDTTPTDPCETAADPYCCYYPNDEYCFVGPPDPCSNASDPWCCRNPNDSSCFMGPPDPCANAFDPFCCRNPNDSSCFVGPPPPPPYDPCIDDPCSCGFCP